MKPAVALPVRTAGGQRAVDGEPGVPRLLPAATRGLGGTSVLEPGLDLVAHLRRHGRARLRGAGLIEEVGAAGLTGRGGAAFPVARKLSAIATAGGSAVAIANGAEGEPASSKDAALLWFAPHLVLDGLQLAAEAVGARTAYLYVHAGADGRGGPDLPWHLQAALAQRAAAGTDRASVHLVEAPPRFLAGEETAAVSRINGGAARPADKQYRRLSARHRRAADAGAERGDAGAPGADRAARGSLVPQRRHPG